MTTSITANEKSMIINLATNDYGNGEPGAQVWSNCLECGDLGEFIPAKGFGGVVASLVKKGLASCTGYGKTEDDVTWLTEAGVEMFESFNHKGRWADEEEKS